MDKVEHSKRGQGEQAYDRGYLPVSDGHSLYYEQAGNPEGVPVVCLHGGPGAGANAWTRRFFDLSHYRVIQFDQRGAGRSTPGGGLRANTTWHLVADTDALRHHLGVDQWLVFGGSWGATLALAYAGQHPDTVRGLVLRGLFLGRRADREWFLDGLSRFYPDAHRRWLEALPEDRRGDPLAGYRDRLDDRDRRVRLSAGGSLDPLRVCLFLVGRGWVFRRLGSGVAHGPLRGPLSGPRLLFDDPEQGALSCVPEGGFDFPGVLVHGRFDMICPVSGAYELQQRWPRLDLQLIQQAGHSAAEPAITEALTAAVEAAKAW